MESGEKQLVQFPGPNPPGEWREAEVREDARLLAIIAAGEALALEALYRRRSTWLYSLLMRMLVNEAEAQEVMQDTFIQIWRRAREYDAARSSPMAWIIMIGRGLALDRLRSRSRRRANQAAYEAEVASLEVEEVHGGRQTERDELAAACAAALYRLPAPQSRALQLAFLRGWTHEEIASAEGEALGTVKSRIRRGLVSLRSALKEFYD